MTNIAVPVPPSLGDMRGELREFVAGMIKKLHLNSHKETPTCQDIPSMIEMLQGELQEFKDQLASDPSDENVLIELMDTANFAFLMFVALRRGGVRSGKEILIDTYLDVIPETGKVYCKRTRQGSQYKMGDEIKGTKRQGYIDIKLQVRAGNFTSLAAPRSHLVWWKYHGSWPVGVVDHINRIRDDDRISNLRDLSFSDNNANNGRSRKYPRYVTPYLPTGRSHLAHYGKFVYQRTYRGVNLRVAYYDTPEEAAEKGAVEWQRKADEIEAKKFIGIADV